MKRRLNFTGRKRINKKDIRVVLLKTKSSRRSFELFFDPTLLNLDSNAEVWIEAYRNTILQRFPFGTIATFEKPKTRYLTEFSDNSTIFFRIKIVEAATGKILASADRIMPEDPDDSRIKSLLPIEQADLGEELWMLDLDSDCPILCVNDQLEDGTSIVNDPLFASLVLPATIRQILSHILASGYEPGDNEYFDQWISFGSQEADQELPDSKDDYIDWINLVVSEFSSKHKFLRRYQQTINNQGGLDT